MTVQADRAVSGADAALRVALVNMPFATSRHPSIQLGLLQATLAEHDIPATSHYFNLHLGKLLGWEVYEIFCRVTPRLLGDWVFARAAFAGDAPEPWQYLASHRLELERFVARFGRGLDYLARLREEIAPAFVEDCYALVDWEKYDVVGFTSIFSQNTAALALARLIKTRHPQIITVFGGANFEDEMGVEYVRGIPWIDYAVIGEGDVAFPALLLRIGAGEEVIDQPGVARRLGESVSFGGQAPQVEHLDTLPDPDYTDYFAAAAEVDLKPVVLASPVRLPYESARGCWWGAKHHCTFCGLNGNGMAFRSKSPARVLAGLDALTGRYGVREFVAVDNIMDMRYIRDVFGVLADRDIGYTFFHEVKANMSREQVAMLARGGVTAIQPGIESLNSHILKLMRKGITGIQNVSLLKHAAIHGIEVQWNILTGFPGEQTEDYERQLAVMRLVPHLPPPYTGPVELHRFSPYYTDAAALGIQNVRPDHAYGQVYPATLDYNRIAYMFEYDAPDTLPPEAHDPLQLHIAWWRRAWGREDGPFLTYQHDGDALMITDGRQPGVNPVVHRIDGLAAQVYLYCDPTHHGPAQVLTHVRGKGYVVEAGQVQTILDHFTALGLAMEEDGHFLSLALPAEPGATAPAAESADPGAATIVVGA